MKINIVTPCTRPDNLRLLFQSITKIPSTDDVTWYIVYDGRKIVSEDYFDFTKLEIPSHLKIIILTFSSSRSIGGNDQRNCALRHITSGWVYFLDDDTLLHPKLFPSVKKQLEIEDKSGFIFSQLFKKNRVRRVSIGKIKEGYIDTGQYLLNYSIIGYRHWQTALLGADGAFIREILELHKDKIKILDCVLSYYNSITAD